MKKTLCFLLTVVIAASGLTFPGLSAAAESNTEKQIYLSGDVNLDGQLSIGDVTELQGGIAELTELSGLQTELARVDGKELSVQTATLIQKYIAEMDTGLPIGEDVLRLRSRSGDRTAGQGDAVYSISRRCLYQ